MVNFLIYLFIAIAHKGKKKKNQSNESPGANKTHIDSLRICLRYKMLKLGSSIDNGSRYCLRALQQRQIYRKEKSLGEIYWERTKMEYHKQQRYFILWAEIYSQQTRTIQPDGRSISGRDLQNYSLFLFVVEYGDFNKIQVFSIDTNCFLLSPLTKSRSSLVEAI